MLRKNANANIVAKIAIMIIGPDDLSFFDLFFLKSSLVKLPLRPSDVELLLISSGSISSTSST